MGPRDLFKNENPMRYVYLIVGAIFGGLLGWFLSLNVVAPFLMWIAGSIVGITVPNGEANWILAAALFIGFIWVGILIGAILFGKLGYRLGKHLHEIDSGKMNQQIEEADVS